MSHDETEGDVSIPLAEAWRRFAFYDLNANLFQRRFLRARIWVLALGVAATVLAIAYAVLVRRWPGASDWRSLLYLLVLATPIAGGVVAAGTSRLDRGEGWMMLRDSAETLKREIYRYRSRVGAYRPEETREKKLLAKLEKVARRLFGTDRPLGRLRPYGGAALPPPGTVAPGDDGFADLTAENYLELRLRDQLNYYRNRIGRFERRLRLLNWSVVVLGGVGTFLAAVGLEIWIPVSVSLSGAFGSYLEMRRLDMWLVIYSRTVMELENVAAWWRSLPPEERARDTRREQLVGRTEAVLQTESSDWRREMEEAIEELRFEEL